jgi:hypothetical protein
MAGAFDAGFLKLTEGGVLCHEFEGCCSLAGP